jgi:hypothetical protein
MINSNKKDIIFFLISKPNYFLGILSTYYPLSQYQLKTYKNLLDWNKISANENINWSNEILVEFDEFIKWNKLTINRSAFIERSLLETFEDKIDWYGNDNYYGDSITANNGIHWDIETIDKFADKTNFEKLSYATSVDWSESLLDKYVGK